MNVILPNKPIKIIPISEFERIICTRQSIDIWSADGIKTKNLLVNLEHIIDIVLTQGTTIAISGIEGGKRRLIWLNFKTNKILMTDDSFSKPVNSLIYNEQNKWLIAFAFDNTIHVFNASDFSLLKCIQTDFCLSYPIMVNPLNTIVGLDYFTHEYRGINMIDFTENLLPKEIKNIAAYNEKYNYVISIDGKSLCAIDLKHQNLIHSITFESVIQHVEVSPDSQTLFISLIYNDVFFFDAEHFKLISQFKHGNNPINTDYQDLFWPMTFNAHSKSVIIGCHSCEVYEKLIHE